MTGNKGFEGNLAAAFEEALGGSDAPRQERIRKPGKSKRVDPDAEGDADIAPGRRAKSHKKPRERAVVPELPNTPPPVVEEVIVPVPEKSTMKPGVRKAARFNPPTDIPDNTEPRHKHPLDRYDRHELISEAVDRIGRHNFPNNDISESPSVEARVEESGTPFEIGQKVKVFHHNKKVDWRIYGYNVDEQKVLVWGFDAQGKPDMYFATAREITQWNPGVIMPRTQERQKDYTSVEVEYDGEMVPWKMLAKNSADNTFLIGGPTPNGSTDILFENREQLIAWNRNLLIPMNLEDVTENIPRKAAKQEAVVLAPREVEAPPVTPPKKPAPIISKPAEAVKVEDVVEESSESDIEPEIEVQSEVIEEPERDVPPSKRLKTSLEIAMEKYKVVVPGKEKPRDVVAEEIPKNPLKSSKEIGMARAEASQKEIEAKLKNDLASVTTFDQLYEILKDVPGLNGTKKYYTGAELREKIDSARAKGDMNEVTRAAGLRDKVFELVTRERLHKGTEDGNTAPYMSYSNERSGSAPKSSQGKTAQVKSHSNQKPSKGEPSGRFLGKIFSAIGGWFKKLFS